MEINKIPNPRNEKNKKLVSIVELYITEKMPFFHLQTNIPQVIQCGGKAAQRQSAINGHKEHKKEH